MANKSGIHIKKGNEGKFTDQAKQAGMSVQKFAAWETAPRSGSR